MYETTLLQISNLLLQIVAMVCCFLGGEKFLYH